MNESLNKNRWLKHFLTFLIPSSLGIFFFMLPLPFDDKVTIPIAILSGALQNLLGSYLPQVMTILIVATFIMTLLIKVTRPKILEKSEFVRSLFDVPIVWFFARLLGALFALAVFFEWGPEIIWSMDTGGTLLYDLLPVLFSVFLFAGMFLPFLLNFGLLELVGALMTKVMRPLFKLPGRSSIDCMASWLGDGTIGVLLTSKQYEDGYYTKKEAAIIGTSFSVVSITFSLVIISQVGLDHMFVPFYLTITIAGFFAALIASRIPPLSRKPNTYYQNQSNEYNENEIPEGMTPLSWGFNKALEKASQSGGIRNFLTAGMKNTLDMWLGVTPIVMALGTLGLIVAEYTPIFQWLGLPFIPLLELLQIPEANEASATLVVGFADMFIPSVIGASIESEMTRFIIAAVSVTQLIYMSEVGGLLLGSKIPITFGELFIIFIQRTLITLPIIAIAAHIIF